MRRCSGHRWIGDRTEMTRLHWPVAAVQRTEVIPGSGVHSTLGAVDRFGFHRGLGRRVRFPRGTTTATSAAGAWSSRAGSGRVRPTPGSFRYGPTEFG